MKLVIKDKLIVMINNLRSILEKNKHSNCLKNELVAESYHAKFYSNRVFMIEIPPIHILLPAIHYSCNSYSEIFEFIEDFELSKFYVSISLDKRNMNGLVKAIENKGYQQHVSARYKSLAEIPKKQEPATFDIDESIENLRKTAPDFVSEANLSKVKESIINNRYYHDQENTIFKIDNQIYIISLACDLEALKYFDVDASDEIYVNYLDECSMKTPELIGLSSQSDFKVTFWKT